jgi:FtsP/CotA-like multicopper oxidase with cupredoxin domain
MKQTKTFRMSRIAAAVAFAVAAPMVAQLAHANKGGYGLAADGVTADPTYYVNTELRGIDPVSLLPTGGLRKFVDGVPGLTAAGANNLGQYIPLAVPNVAGYKSYPGSNYYEIAVVEYTEKMHSDLPKATTLRGYVQIVPAGTAGAKQLGTIAGVKTSSPSTWVADVPHYLGPSIVAMQGTPTRIKFFNLLPNGKAVTTTVGGKLSVVPGQRNGDLFIPVDETIVGAGLGSDGVTNYLQNREELHLHGGDSPWISDGTPHQWIVPSADEILLKSTLGAAGYNDFARGVSAKDVPDMQDIDNPEPGTVTYYWPNGESGRLMFYHDHAVGITRLNVYTGTAAGYVLADPVENAMMQTVLGTTNIYEAEGIPLVFQDKTFVPSDIALQDTKWDQEAWGKPGDLWYPHVYETNQAPRSSSSPDGTHPVGRWDWGPWFWPVFPSLYNLPTGDYGDVSTTPEGFMDTPLVNGTAYPTMTVDPKAYRFRILNASNDRMINLGLYLAASNKFDTTAAAARNMAAMCDEVSANPVGDCTEVKMVNFDNSYAPVAATDRVTPHGSSTGFPVIGGVAGLDTGWGAPDLAFHIPGVPDPAFAGPPIIQIGTEGGLLPQAVEIPSTPVNYEFCTRCITINNILEHGLLLGPAERADTIIDFSQYAGKTLIVYNDAPAPVPAQDQRIDYYTGNPDFSDSGGAPTTPAGYGPNTRTWMQINVRAGTPAAPVTVADLTARLRTAYAATQPAPIVAQPIFNGMNFSGTGTGLVQTAAADQVAYINTGSLQQPTFDYTPGIATSFGGINLATSGHGYITPPAITYTNPTGVTGSGAVATAGLKIDAITLTNAGSGYVVAPTVAITTTAAGSGAAAVAHLGIFGSIANGGSGYTTAPAVTVKLGATALAGVTSAVATLGVQSVTVTNATTNHYQRTGNINVTFTAAPAGGVTATGTVRTTTVGAGTSAYRRVTGITITNPGSGYTTLPTATITAASGTGSLAATTTMSGLVASVSVAGNFNVLPITPTITFAAPPAGTTATATATVGVGSITLTSPVVTDPTLAGGRGYTDMTQVIVNITGGGAGGSGGATPANAATAMASGAVAYVSLDTMGSYTGVPNVIIAAPPASYVDAAGNTVNNVGRATATATGTATTKQYVQSKAIQELFDPNYGRMNATLGIELPFTSALTQTTIPLGYIDPVTDTIGDGETQIWKITHNGVDSHPVHFHLVNVQLINRVGWDGTLKPVPANEQGWKETIRMNPLEDVIIAIRAKKPTLTGVTGANGFGLPESVRLMDPSQPQYAMTGFTQIDVKTGLPGVIYNDTVNYGWEYVWHCHILGHEENDFMRPLVFNAKEGPATAPTLAAFNNAAYVAGTSVALTWADNSTSEYKFLVERATNTAGTNWAPLGNALANATTFTDPVGPTTGQYKYRVTAVGAKASGVSNVISVGAVPVTPPPAAPSNFLGVSGFAGGAINATLSWSPVTGVTRYDVQWSTAADMSVAPTVLSNVTTTNVFGQRVYTFTAPPAGQLYFQVRVTTAAGTSAWSQIRGAIVR